MKVKILDVNIENVVKGKSRYSKAAVTYSYNGEARTQNIMSFTNPAIFKAVQEKVGQEVEITITKNAAGYNEWASLDDIGSGASSQASTLPSSAPPAASAGPTTRVTGSNYETPAERAAKQVYIVKQSSISAAVALAGNNKEKQTAAEIIKTAQEFVDFVFDKDTSMDSLQSDVL
jgi:hypothetical protein